MIDKCLFAFYGALAGFAVGLVVSQAKLDLAKAYNLEADRTMVDASQTYFDAAQRYSASVEVADRALDVCLGRVGL